MWTISGPGVFIIRKQLHELIWLIMVRQCLKFGEITEPMADNDWYGGANDGMIHNRRGICATEKVNRMIMQNIFLWDACEMIDKYHGQWQVESSRMEVPFAFETVKPRTSFEL